MKYYLWAVGLSALVTAGSVYAQEVDFRAVNPVMQSLVDATIAANENVDFAYPTFDPSYSDLKAEKLKYDLQGSIKNTPWLSGGHADVSGTSTYRADRTPGHMGVEVTFNASSKTDVLALIRYSATLAMKKRQHVNPKFDARIDAHLNHLMVARSLDEVYPILQSGQQIAKDMLADQVNHVRDTPVYPDWVRVQDQNNKIELKSVEEGGHITKIIVTTDSLDRLIYRKNHPLKVGQAVLTFAPDTLSLDNRSFYEESPEALDSLKTKLENHLQGLQEGNPEDKNYVQQNVFRQALIEFKRALRAENIR